MPAAIRIIGMLRRGSGRRHCRSKMPMKGSERVLIEGSGCPAYEPGGSFGPEQWDSVDSGRPEQRKVCPDEAQDRDHRYAGRRHPWMRKGAEGWLRFRHDVPQAVQAYDDGVRSQPARVPTSSCAPHPQTPGRRKAKTFTGVDASGELIRAGYVADPRRLRRMTRFARVFSLGVTRSACDNCLRGMGPRAVRCRRREEPG